MSSLKPLGHHWWLITSRCIALLLRTVCPLLRTPTYSMETLWIEERNLQRLSSFCLPSYCSTPTTCIWTEATMRTTSWTSGNMLDHPFKWLLNKPIKSSSVVNKFWSWKTKYSRNGIPRVGRTPKAFFFSFLFKLNKFFHICFFLQIRIHKRSHAEVQGRFLSA